MNKDYYKTLGVEKDATPEDIKKAYRKEANEHHPDNRSGSALGVPVPRSTIRVSLCAVVPVSRRAFGCKHAPIITMLDAVRYLAVRMIMSFYQTGTRSEMPP